MIKVNGNKQCWVVLEEPLDGNGVPEIDRTEFRRQRNVWSDFQHFTVLQIQMTNATILMTYFNPHNLNLWHFKITTCGFAEICIWAITPRLWTVHCRHCTMISFFLRILIQFLKAKHVFQNQIWILIYHFHNFWI